MGENMCEYWSSFFFCSSLFPKEEFSQEHVRGCEGGQIKAAFYNRRLQPPIYLVQVKSRTFHNKEGKDSGWGKNDLF